MRCLPFTPLILALATSVAGASQQNKFVSQNKARVGFAYPFSTTVESDPIHQASFFEKRVKDHPENAADLVTLGAIYAAEAKRTENWPQYEKAEELAKTSLQLQPKRNTAAKLLLAQIHESRHEFQKSIALANEVLQEASAKDSGALATLVTSHLALGNLKEAGRAADQLVDQRPTTGPLTLRGLVLLEDGREEEGLYEFQRALQVEDLNEARDSSWLRSLWARHSIERGRLGEAQQALSAAMKITPQEPLVLNLLGALRYKQKKWISALAMYQKAFDLSKDPVHLLAVVKINRIMGHDQEANNAQVDAEALIRKELQGRYGHRNELATLLLSKTESREENAREAIDLMKQEVAIRPTAANYVILANSYAHASRWQEAKDAIDSALWRGAPKAADLFLASTIYEASGRKKLAQLYAQKARQHDPSFNEKYDKW